MEAFVMIIAALAGVAVGVGAGRLFLEGVLDLRLQGEGLRVIVAPSAARSRTPSSSTAITI